MSNYRTKALAYALTALFMAGSATAADKTSPQKSKKEPLASHAWVQYAEGTAEVGAAITLLGPVDLDGGTIVKTGVRGAFLTEEEKRIINREEGKIMELDNFVRDTKFLLGKHYSGTHSGFGRGTLLPSSLTAAERAAKERKLAVAEMELKGLKKSFFKKYAGRLIFQGSVMAAIPILTLDGFARSLAALGNQPSGLIPGQALVETGRAVAGNTVKKGKTVEGGQAAASASEQSSNAGSAK